MRKQPNSIFGIEPKITLANITLVANTFVWYAIILAFLQNTLTNSELLLWIWSLHFSGIIISALAGVFWVRKIDQTRFLKLWLIFGGISSLSLFAINSSSFLVIIGFLAFLLGVALGIGMPTCMKYYTDNIPLEKRGRISGFIMLAFAIGTAALSMVPFNALIIGVILAVWRFSSLAVFSLDSSKKIEQKKNDATYKQILGHKPFVLYFIPWMVFSLVNYIGAPVQSTLFGEQVTEQFTLIQNGLMGVFAVAGGFLLDYIGRKRIAIAGFVMVGLGTAVLGIYPESEACWYFSAIVDGVGWGFLFVLFVLTIWGDLSYNSSSDKYYALGMLPFFASKFLERTLGKYISALVPDYALFSFTAFFLFLAVLPLVYAPETLPEKYIRERELKSYIEKAKREKEKYA